VLTFHNFNVQTAAWSKAGKLASGIDDKTVKIWSVGSTGSFECESTLSGSGHASKFLYKKCVFLLPLVHVLTSQKYSLTLVAWSKDGWKR